MRIKHIILDLDQTLISSEEPEDLQKYFDKDQVSEDDYNIIGLDNYNMDDCFTVFERPDLQDFLTYIFKNFKVSVWTAATKDYALSIIQNVILKNKPERKLDYIFFNYHCKISKKVCKKLFRESHTKKISVLSDVFNLKDSFKTENTVIIDDYEKVYYKQKGNCIIAPSFNFEDFVKDKNLSDDTFLKGLISSLKKDEEVNIPEINSHTINENNLTTHKV